MVTTEQKPHWWRWFELGLLIVGLGAHLYIALSPANSLMNWYNTDDAFYYYKVAINITSGHGVTFDGINPTNGFHPLWMLVCIPVFWLAQFDLILPLRVLVVVSALFSIGSGIFLFRLLKKFVSIEIAALLAVIWMFQPSIHLVVVYHGMESTISAFFLIAYLYFLVHWQDEKTSRNKLITLGLLGGLAILSRLDNVFIVILMAGWFALKPLGSYVRNLIVSDLTLIFISGLLSYYIRLRSGPFYQEYSVSLSAFLVLAFLSKPILFFLFDRYQLDEKPSLVKSFCQSLLAVTASSAVLALGLFLLHLFNVIPILPRSAVIVGQIVLIDWAGTLLWALGLQLFMEWLASTSTEELVPSLKLQSRSDSMILIQRGFWLCLPIGALLGGFMLWSYAHVGTFMPVSGQIKHWWAGFSNTVYGSPTATTRQLLGVVDDARSWELASSYFNAPAEVVVPYFKPRMRATVALVVNVLVLTLTAGLMKSRRKWLPSLLDRFGLFVLFLGLYAHIFYYTSTSYIHMRSWYWVGEMFFTMLILGVVLESLRLTLERWQVINWGWNLAMLGIGASVLFSFTQYTKWNFPYQAPSEKREAYLDEARFLEKRTSPGSMIGMTGGGTFAYFVNDRIVVNLDGLINSNEYFEAMQNGKAAQFWDKMGLDYVFGNAYMLEQADPFYEMLAGRLQPLVSNSGRRLYRYESMDSNDE